MLRQKKISFSSMQNVLEHMQKSLHHFSKSKKQSRFVPFLTTYYFVTKEVTKKSKTKKKYFDNIKALEQIDLFFAELYFNPNSIFVRTTRKIKPWQQYLVYAQRRKQNAFVSLLLGINAHINADLPVTLAVCNYSERQDFLRINTILEKIIPKLMKYLALEEHNIFGLSALFFRRLVHKEFKKIVVGWREDAWHNAQLLRNDSTRIKELLDLTELNAQEIIFAFETFETPHQLLQMLHCSRVRLI